MYSHRAVHLLALFTVGVSSGTWFYEVMCSVCADDGDTDLASYSDSFCMWNEKNGLILSMESNEKKFEMIVMIAVLVVWAMAVLCVLQSETAVFFFFGFDFLFFFCLANWLL